MHLQSIIFYKSFTTMRTQPNIRQTACENEGGKTSVRSVRETREVNVMHWMSSFISNQYCRNISCQRQ